MANKPEVDYSLYLVTGRDLLPPGKAIQSIQGGVTLVQVREKTADTGEFLEIARQSKVVCRKYNVPIFINDRIDIALAIGADGVHLGQTDMPVSVARALLPPNTIIGVTVNTREHVRKAVADGADYVGMGPVWGTTTKNVLSPLVGPRGVAKMLEELEGTDVKAVAIAGIKSSNTLHLLHGSVSKSGRALDGVAVVSDIVASTDPRAASARISSTVNAFKTRQQPSGHQFSMTNPVTERPHNPETLKELVGETLTFIKKFSPLVHQITNNVVTNQSANATLALGASPIMATSPEEMEDLSKAIGALLVNFGTIKDLDGMLEAGRNANINRKPIVFDPVGVGATSFRRSSANELLNTWQATVIKGNAGELAALANSSEVKARGVDSVGSGFANPAQFVRDLARAERCVVVLTGAIDWVSDGHTVVKLSNGHPLLGDITGSGCMVGTTVATFCGGMSMSAIARLSENTPEDGWLTRGDMLVAAVGGVLAVTVASELAAVREDVKGSGTFLPALIDELGKLTPETLAKYAKLEVVS
ncbi:Hydroxyethylthiazole kinase [Cristinia sonorae]|uniref:Hydroxyethylthiazole kinase n=1 Tax=Cristinia sonorae TaxID=1940300 RepID=A0A8K0UHA6_9AGAR|nr:Hydroxyethylthiazole kinase [Cristinia sonorae]